MAAKYFETMLIFEKCPCPSRMALAHPRTATWLKVGNKILVQMFFVEPGASHFN